MAKELEPFVRLFITSRPSLDLEMVFANLYRIDIAAHNSDIQAYLEYKLDRTRRMTRLAAKDPKLKMDIVQSLLEKADGM
jgi:ankyrin repeat domain-containing protein 50